MKMPKKGGRRLGKGDEELKFIGKTNTFLLNFKNYQAKKKKKLPTLQKTRKPSYSSINWCQ